MTAPVLRRAISTQADVEAIRHDARTLALEQGFGKTGAGELLLIVSELAANILKYCGTGQVTVTRVESQAGVGIAVEATDRGPGIGDVERAFQSGFSTGGGLGQGLPLVRRLADTIDVHSSDEGTRIVATKWRS